MILFVGLLFGSFTVAFGIAFFKSVQVAKYEAQHPSVLSQLPKVDDATLAGRNYSLLGSKNPKIKIVTFSDFGCVRSKNMYKVLHDLVIANASDYDLIYRDYPVVTQNSAILSRTARCAGEQGLFWPMHDYLFDHQGIGSQEEILKAAKEVGLKTKEFAICMENEKYSQEITYDLNVGKKFNLAGTPSIFINNYQLPAGEIPKETLEQIISEITKNPNAR